MTNQVYLLPEKVEVVQFLDASLQKPYAESVKSYNNPEARETLGEFSNSDGILAGSNPFMILQLIKAGLLPKHIDHIVTRQDLEKTITKYPNFLRGTFNDFGLALVTPYDNWDPNKDGKKPNDLLAKQLAEQLISRGIELGTGKLIPFSALTINENENSAYGFVSDLSDLATKETILDLDQFNWILTRDKGLASAYLDDAGWSRDYRYLAGSYSCGRVVGVEVVDAKNFELGYSDERIREVLKETGFSGATDPILSYLRQHN